MEKSLFSIFQGIFTFQSGDFSILTVGGVTACKFKNATKNKQMKLNGLFMFEYWLIVFDDSEILGLKIRKEKQKEIVVAKTTFGVKKKSGSGMQG